MQNFIKTIISAVKIWTKGKIKDSTADWNQNDSSSDNYVKNRTHWEEILANSPEFKIDFSYCGNVNWGQTKVGYLYEYINDVSLVVGKKYEVVFDGKKYDCVAFVDTGYQNIVIGNGAFVADSNTDNGMPFAIGNYREGNTDAYVIASDQNSHDIYFAQTIVHKLDSKYLDFPTDIATLDDVQNAIDLVADDVQNAIDLVEDRKMNATNPTGTGSFSLNRGVGKIGENSSVFGVNNIASVRSQNVIGEYNEPDLKYSYSSSNQTTTLLNTSSYYFSDEFSFDEKTGYFTLIDNEKSSGSSGKSNKYMVNTSGPSTYIYYLNECTQSQKTNTVVNGVTQYRYTYNVTRYSKTEVPVNVRGAYAHIVGNGVSNTERSNAHTLDWEGNAWYQGDVYVGSTSGTNMDAGSKKLATEEYVDTQIAAIPTPDVSGQIDSHNISLSAHNDIRLLVDELTNRLNTLADSDDATLDQMSELVEYIKSNKTLIEEITTKKINIGDIINNLTTNVDNKPLSAAQGVVLKELIDAIKVPTKVSELTNDSGYLTEHQSLEGLATEEYVNTQIAGIPIPDVSGQIETHNTSVDSHADIRESISELSALVGEGRGSIIDVIELPTENIDEKSWYRLITAKFLEGRAHADLYTVYCVETLPEVGKPVSNIEMTDGNIYYVVSTGETYGYVDEILSAGLSIPVGWYPGETLVGAFGNEYGGIVTSIDGIPEDDEKYRILVEYTHYSYKDKWNPIDIIGWRGTAGHAEIFNGFNNIASGYYSHAEGYKTAASGRYSHVEGRETVAEGDCSHAEGYYTTASGNYSHAEGDGTIAFGYSSHAEGRETIAGADYQHVQGKYNIKDHYKYAHIVGNGSGSKRSNAHTLDWDGNAWYQGNIYIGGTSQDDTAAKKIATEEYVNNLISSSGGSGSGIQNITTPENSGLKVTRTNNDVNIEFDDEIVFIFDGGSALD